MSAAGEPLRELNDCGCCEGVSIATPAEIVNPPGLPEIEYRVGDYGRFNQTMLARLASVLPDLKTRDTDDFSIALLDAWAVAADVLTFYQERIANESYLRTATERRSLLELARAIGYELRSGVAASVYLTFTIDDAPGVPGWTTIEAGTRVQSVPKPGEQAQTFETVETIEARSQWNAIRPRLTTRHPFVDAAGDLLTTFHFEGVSTGFRLGDGALLAPDDREPVLCLVTRVIPDYQQQRTLVELRPVPIHSAFERGIRSGLTTELQIAALPSGPSELTTRFFSEPVRARRLRAFAAVDRFVAAEIFANVVATQPPPPGVLAFRTKAAIFGNNAPPFDTLPTNLVSDAYEGRRNSWAESTLADYHNDPRSNNVYLDAVYSTIAPDSYIVLLNGSTGKWGVHRVESTSEITESDFTISAKISRLTLDNGHDFSKFGIRTTSVLGQSEQVKLARLPISTAVGGASIELDGLIDGLVEGRPLLVCGELVTARGVRACEHVVIQDVAYHPDDGGYTTVALQAAGLQNCYVRGTVTISGNVALATHGESNVTAAMPISSAIRQEVLGSGDASQPYQRFTLRKPPLTYVSAATASGRESTLKVYVNDVQWHEAPYFYGRGPTERIFVTRTSDDGKTTVQFGDGREGARLPTGVENVRAEYRTGIGLAGMVDAGQLSQLMSRPSGVRGVDNPQPASGGDGPETVDDARRNAPLRVMTLDRIVSLQDYEHFARAFAGISKAKATWTWDGCRQGIFLTVAGPAGDVIEASSQTYKNLLLAIQRAGDPYVPVQVRTYSRRFFALQATITIGPDRLAGQVLGAVEEALRACFSFDARDLGQPVALSEVTATIQSRVGVVAVVVNALYRSYPPELEPVALNQLLTAALPLPGAGADTTAAELLTLDPGPLDLTVTMAGGTRSDQ